jgi:hypothetical protein
MGKGITDNGNIEGIRLPNAARVIRTMLITLIINRG